MKLLTAILANKDGVMIQQLETEEQYKSLVREMKTWKSGLLWSKLVYSKDGRDFYDEEYRKRLLKR